MKSIALIALLGLTNAISLKDSDLDMARDMGIDTESYAEKQERSKEVQMAWRQVQNNQLKADTEKSIALAEEYEQKEKVLDQKYSKVFGFEPSHFTIVNNIQLQDDMDRDLKQALEQQEAQKFIAQAHKDTQASENTYKSLVASQARPLNEREEEKAMEQREQADLKFSKKNGFEPSHFIITSE